MKSHSYRLIFDGPDINEELMLHGSTIADAARTADEFRELLGWLSESSDTAPSGDPAAQVAIRIESVDEPVSQPSR